MTYRTLKGWSYQPPDYPSAWRLFQEGDLVEYPGADFPSPLPIGWLLEDGALVQN